MTTAPLSPHGRAVEPVFYPYTPGWGFYEPSDLAHGDPTEHADYRMCSPPEPVAVEWRYPWIP